MPRGYPAGTTAPDGPHLHTQVLHFVGGYIEANHGLAPTVRECARALGRRSVCHVQEALCALADDGALHRLPRKERAMELARPLTLARAPDGAPLFFVPVPPTLRPVVHGGDDAA